MPDLSIALRMRIDLKNALASMTRCQMVDLALDRCLGDGGAVWPRILRQEAGDKEDRPLLMSRRPGPLGR